jgi:hypothetical protein
MSKCVYSENYIKINNYNVLIMSTEEIIQENNNPDIGICEECNSEINCEKDNIYILTKDENDKLWCQCCFEELWKEYSNNGWTGDDIEYYLELENEEKEVS